jgi:hypothetical protein
VAASSGSGVAVGDRLDVVVNAMSSSTIDPPPDLKR